jgi:hypothetical protein
VTFGLFELFGRRRFRVKQNPIVISKARAPPGATRRVCFTTAGKRLVIGRVNSPADGPIINSSRVRNQGRLKNGLQEDRGVPFFRLDKPLARCFTAKIGVLARQCRMPKVSGSHVVVLRRLRHSGFVIVSSFGLRHSVSP